MDKTASSRMDLLQGTLDLMILRSLVFGRAHGHAISKHIRRTSGETLSIETGSLYPALHRLEKQKLVASFWETSEKGKRAKYYTLTARGRRRLEDEQSRWDKMSRAIGQVLASVSWSGTS
jgi:PadR family transcriptional regulator, regulatory protein PadR